MKEALIALTLFGCDDTGAQCQLLRTAGERFASVEECRAASTRLLSQSAEEDYPVVMARCDEPVEIAEVDGGPDGAAAAPFPKVEQYPVKISPAGPVYWRTVAVQVVPGRREVREAISALSDSTVRATAVIAGHAKAVADWINPF